MKILPLRESAFLISDTSHGSSTHQAIIKAHNKSQFNFPSLRCMSEKQLAGPVEDGLWHTVQLQLPPQRQLLGIANQAARTSCLILGTHYLQLYYKIPNHSKAFKQAGRYQLYQAIIHTQFCRSARSALPLVLVLKQWLEGVFKGG